MATYEKSHSLRSLRFDSGVPQDFDNIATVGAGIANTVVQARFPVPQRCKIYKVVVNYSAIGTGGNHLFNIVQGNVAEVGVGAVDTVSTNGTTVFAGDQILAAGSADVPQVFIPPVWDAIYDTGSLLTIRCVTPASTGSLTNLKVTIFVKSIDAHPAATEIPNSDGSFGFSPLAF